MSVEVIKSLNIAEVECYKVFRIIDGKLRSWQDEDEVEYEVGIWYTAVQKEIQTEPIKPPFKDSIEYNELHQRNLSLRKLRGIAKQKGEVDKVKDYSNQLRILSEELKVAHKDYQEKKIPSDTFISGFHCFKDIEAIERIARLLQRKFKDICFYRVLLKNIRYEATQYKSFDTYIGDKMLLIEKIPLIEQMDEQAKKDRKEEDDKRRAWDLLLNEKNRRIAQLIKEKDIKTPNELMEACRDEGLI